MTRKLYSALILCLLICSSLQGQGQSYDTRIRYLISQMTLEEKISQLVYTAPGIPRLNIPKYDWNSECLHGIIDDSVTVFPQSIGLAAMWNPELIYEMGSAISDEGRILFRTRGKGMSYWSPNLNLARDPRWGRTQETFGEDPFLGSRIAVQYIKGLQGNDPKYWKAIASPKHFCVHSGPEPLRYMFNAVVNQRDFWESYMPMWKAAFTEGKAHGVMAAYNAVNGIPNAANKHFIHDILKKRWGFDGYVVTDCGAIVYLLYAHWYAYCETETVRMALEAGMDLECGSMLSDYAMQALKEEVITEAQIDSAVYHLLMTRFKLGLFDDPDSVSFNKIPLSDLVSKEHVDIAYKQAQQSMVLLKNDKTLPLSKDYDSIVVIGPNAVGNNFGCYSGYTPDATDILKGITKKVAPKTKVNYFTGCSKIGYFTELVQTRYLKTPDGKPGLKAEYFNNMDFSGEPALIKTDSLINYDWHEGSPDPSIRPDSFCIRWSGFIHADTSDIYTIKMISDDGVRVYFNDTLVINDWQWHSSTELVSNVYMEAGHEYPIVIEYFDHAIYASARFEFGTYTTGDARIDSMVKVASKYDAIIFAGGLGVEFEMEDIPVYLPGFYRGDRTNLDLPAIQVKFLKALKKANKPLVFVMQNGSSMSINELNDSIPAIIEMWYGSHRGGDALADIIFGDYNPSGKLPLTFYKSVNDLPEFTDYNMEGRTYKYNHKEPLYPFGYGLSYTTYRYNSMNLAAKEIDISVEDTLPIKFNISNTGAMDGDEIVQFYFRSLDAKMPMPIKSLAGFKRVHVRSGRSVSDSVKVYLMDFAVFDSTLDDYRIEPGRYEVQMAASAKDVRIVDTVLLYKDSNNIPLPGGEDPDRIWPNPANSLINIELNSVPAGNYKLTLYDIMGNRIDDFISRKVTEKQYQIEFTGLSSGMYYIVFDSGSQRIEKKFAVRNE